MIDDNLRTITGEITIIIPDERGILITDSDGMAHPVKWDPAQDKEFLRLRRGWLAKITLERRGNDWVAIYQSAVTFDLSKPKSSAPAYLVLVKKWTDLYIACQVPDELDFNNARTAILDAVKEDLERVMREGGA